MSKLLLVDGSNLLFQMFYGMPSRIVNHDGIAIQGVIGFLGAFRRILAMTSPTHVAVIFDGEQAGERRLINPDYKANRPDFAALPDEESPFSQLGYIQTALDLLSVKQAETCGCETDDLIASYCATYSCETNIVIASFDSDFFQLLSNTVSLLRYRGDKTTVITPELFSNRFGILPSQYADYKSLVGDPADNIRGITGIGPKRAAKLLSLYPTLDSLLNALDSVTPSRIQNALKAEEARLLLNRRLITLSKCPPLPYALDELTYTAPFFTVNELLIKLALKRP